VARASFAGHGGHGRDQQQATAEPREVESERQRGSGEWRARAFTYGVAGRTGTHGTEGQQWWGRSRCMAATRANHRARGGR
jgi:hypothetical protein